MPLRNPRWIKLDLANLERLKLILNEVLEFKPKELKSKQAAAEYLVEMSKKIFRRLQLRLSP